MTLVVTGTGTTQVWMQGLLTGVSASHATTPVHDTYLCSAPLSIPGLWWPVNIIVILHIMTLVILHL